MGWTPSSPAGQSGKQPLPKPSTKAGKSLLCSRWVCGSHLPPEPILRWISALHGTWPHNPCCWLSCTVTQTLHTQPPADTGFSRWGVVPLRAVSDVVGTHPEAKEHSVSRWLSRNMNVMKSHACNQHEESQVSAPHGVVSNTPLRVVHKSLKRNSDRHGSGNAPAVRRHMTLDVAGVAACCCQRVGILNKLKEGARSWSQMRQ